MPRSNRWAGAAALGLAGLLAPGCTADHLERKDTVTLQAGDAVAFNQAVQTLDPWPPYVGDRRIPHHGAVVECAIYRYRTDQVKVPVGLQTTEAAPPTQEEDDTVSAGSECPPAQQATAD